MSTIFKVESGIQLLARLRRRPDIENFYPVLFEKGPMQGEVIEIYTEENASFLIIDIITDALIPTHLGGVDAGVLIFNTDGNINFDTLVNILRRKLLLRIANGSQEQTEFTDEELHNLLHNCLLNLHILEIYDATQFYTTLCNLESILVDKSNISLIVFHTLTAFYWSEQGFKITKMDVYLKNLLKLIHKITKEYKITSLFTRPEYFTSCKDPNEKLEGFPEQPTLEYVNYRMQILYNGAGSYHVNVRTLSKLYKKTFIIRDVIEWL